MKVLVATEEGQGQRPNDFQWSTEGELVYIGFVCDRDVGNPDGACGCSRAFAGLETHKAGTTAKVIQRDWTWNDYREAVRAGLVDAGWMDASDTVSEILDEAMTNLRIILENSDVGDVLEHRSPNVQVRLRNGRDADD